MTDGPMMLRLFIFVIGQYLRCVLWFDTGGAGTACRAPIRIPPNTNALLIFLFSYFHSHHVGLSLIWVRTVHNSGKNFLFNVPSR